MGDGRIIDQPPASAARPRTGIIEWRNPRNGFFVTRLHYTADPAKRSEEWKRSVSENLSLRAFTREYEISWSTPEGEPVTPEFSADVHVQEIPPEKDRKLLRFWDFGSVSPVVLFNQLTPYGQLVTLRELCPFNTPLDQLLPMVRAITVDLVMRADHFDAGDPEGDSQGTLGTVTEVLQRHGIVMHTNRVQTDASYACLRDWLLRRVQIPRFGQQPAWVISPRCPNLIEAASGGFHRSPHPPYRPVKTHPMKDLMDAARYGFDNLASAGADTQAAWKKLAEGDRAW